MTFDQLQKVLERELRRQDWSQTEHGGWVEKTAYVAPTARVEDGAVVFGNATVFDNARVYGKAWVFGDAQVCGNARVYGDAWVYGNAHIYGDAQVYGYAHVKAGKIDFGSWSSGDACAQYQAMQNLATELQSDLEESARRLVS